MTDGTYNPGAPFSKGSGFGMRPDPLNKNNTEYHKGQDYPAPTGTPIPAASTGKVVYSGFNNSYGNTVIIESKGSDGSPYNTLYAHQQGRQMPDPGVTVNKGDTIGEVGETGSRVNGPHLHFEVIPGKHITEPLAGGPTGIDKSVPRVDPNSFNKWNEEGAYNPPQPAAPAPKQTSDAGPDADSSQQTASTADAPPSDDLPHYAADITGDTSPTLFAPMAVALNEAQDSASDATTGQPQPTATQTEDPESQSADATTSSPAPANTNLSTYAADITGDSSPTLFAPMAVALNEVQEPSLDQQTQDDASTGLEDVA